MNQKDREDRVRAILVKLALDVVAVYEGKRGHWDIEKVAREITNLFSQ
jgi:hypothetical protein